MILPAGKGMWIWKAIYTESGDPIQIANLAQEAGFGHVLIKVAKSIYRYNVSADVGAITDELRRRGIQVWGWNEVWLDYPETEAEIVFDQVERFGMDGLVVDAEGSCVGKPTQAARFMRRMRALTVELSIGLSSYRYPSVHTDFPWAAFRANGLTFDTPQVYWVDAHNPREQLLRSFSEFFNMVPVLPYFPTGAAFRQMGSGWMPTPAEIQEFCAAVEELHLEGANFWEWWQARERVPAAWDAVSDWELGPPVPPVAPRAVGKVRVTPAYQYINVRFTPTNVGNNDAGDLYKNAELYFFEEDGLWVRVGGNLWIKTGPGLAEIITRY